MSSFRKRILRLLGSTLVIMGCGNDAPPPHTKVLRADTPGEMLEVGLTTSQTDPAQAKPICFFGSTVQTWITADHLPSEMTTPEALVRADQDVKFASREVPDPEVTFEYIYSVQRSPTGARWYAYEYTPKGSYTSIAFLGYVTLPGLPGVVRVRHETFVEFKKQAQPYFLKVLDTVRVEEP